MILHVHDEQTRKMVYSFNERGDHEDLEEDPDQPRPMFPFEQLAWLADLPRLINDALNLLFDDSDTEDYGYDGEYYEIFQDDDLQVGGEVEVVTEVDQNAGAQEEEKEPLPGSKKRTREEDEEEEEKGVTKRFRYDKNNNSNTQNQPELGAEVDMEFNQSVADVVHDPLPGGSQKRARNDDDDEVEEDSKRFKWDWYDFPESDIESDEESDYSDDE